MSGLPGASETKKACLARARQVHSVLPARFGPSKNVHWVFLIFELDSLHNHPNNSNKPTVGDLEKKEESSA